MNKYAILTLLVLFCIIPTVSADGNGEIDLISPNILRMSYDQEIRSLNATVMAWAEDTPIQFWETDRDLIVEYEIQNNNFFALTLKNSPYGREREYQIFYCTMGEIPDYDRYSYNQNYSKCEGYNYIYKLRDIREGRKTLVKIPPMIDGENPFRWYVGDGAGGGGGLPVCEGIAIQTTVNQTDTTIGSSFEMGGRATWYGASSAGCIIYFMGWYSDDTVGGTALIQAGNHSQLLTNCNGQSCAVTPTFGSWYYKDIQCDSTESPNPRDHYIGIYAQIVSNTRYWYSNQIKEQLCYTPQPDTTRIHFPKKDDNEELFFLPFAFVILSVFVFKARKDQDP